MNRTATLVRWTAGLAAIAAMASGALASAQSSPDTGQSASTITVRVYDYAHVNRKALLAAEDQVGSILRAAGIDSHWVDCPTSHAELNKYPDCTTAGQVNDYILRIQPNAMAVLEGSSQTALGSATDCEQGTCTASVFVDRVRNLAGGDTAPVEILLGRVMARETGQMLIGAGFASRSGIMKASWSPRELSLLAGPDMRFSPVEARAMRARLTEREQAAEVRLARAGSAKRNSAQ